MCMCMQISHTSYCSDDDLTLLAGEMGLIDVSSSSALDLKDDGTSSSKVTLE